MISAGRSSNWPQRRFRPSSCLRTHFSSSHARRSSNWRLASRVPLIFSEREGVDAGGLASYGVNAAENYRRAADYIDKILKGAAAR